LIFATMIETSPTDRRLLEVAIDHFGRLGREGASTRAIARDAGTLMSSITYHFKGKDGLYLACAEHIASTIRAKTAPIVDRLALPTPDAQARATIDALIGGLIVIMMQEDVAPMARFVVREQMSPTRAFDILYDGAIGHVIEPLVALLMTVTGDRLGLEEARIRAFSLLGQVYALRFGRAALMRLTRWESVGPRETELARAAILANVDAILAELAGNAA
jgi:AcrR family transcriptional regulator